jgi:hypothetical protein
MHRLEKTFLIGSFSGFCQHLAAIIESLSAILLSSLLLVWILYLGMYEAETYPLSVEIIRYLDDSEYNTGAHLSNHILLMCQFSGSGSTSNLIKN